MLSRSAKAYFLLVADHRHRFPSTCPTLQQRDTSRTNEGAASGTAVVQRKQLQLAWEDSLFAGLGGVPF